MLPVITLRLYFFLEFQTIFFFHISELSLARLAIICGQKLDGGFWNLIEESDLCPLSKDRRRIANENLVARRSSHFNQITTSVTSRLAKQNLLPFCRWVRKHPSCHSELHSFSTTLLHLDLGLAWWLTKYVPVTPKVFAVLYN